MWTREAFAALCDPPVIGMIHLASLPGAPGWGGDAAAVERAALADADALVEGGVGALMVENYHDAPFWPERVPPVTVAALALMVAAVRRRHPRLPVGVNVLRNDAAAALAVAVATGAAFIRVNVHVGAVVTDQGLLRGRAHHTLRARRDLGAVVGVLADLRVKHGAPLAPRPLAEEARDLRQRGLADGVIVTGAATGGEADPEELAAARAALPDCPLLVGSGLTAENLGRYARWADGWIVGTSLQHPGSGSRRPVDTARVAAFVAAAKTEGSASR
ncbi:MAG: BtpA/SgcQ family protein [Candidatus Krumholzibacteriia bacterium]